MNHNTFPEPSSQIDADIRANMAIINMAYNLPLEGSLSKFEIPRIEAQPAPPPQTVEPAPDLIQPAADPAPVAAPTTAVPSTENAPEETNTIEWPAIEPEEKEYTVEDVTAGASRTRRVLLKATQKIKDVPLKAGIKAEQAVQSVVAKQARMAKQAEANRDNPKLHETRRRRLGRVAGAAALVTAGVYLHNNGHDVSSLLSDASEYAKDTYDFVKHPIDVINEANASDEAYVAHFDWSDISDLGKDVIHGAEYINEFDSAHAPDVSQLASVPGQAAEAVSDVSKAAQEYTPAFGDYANAAVIDTLHNSGALVAASERDQLRQPLANKK